MIFKWLRREPSRGTGPLPDVAAAPAAPPAGFASPPNAASASEPDAGRSGNDRSAIDAARARFIVFRHSYPPPPHPGLSFYGGAPIGPAGLAWPRGEADGRPLTFVMQWDAAALAAEDATGLLPPDGALYLFSNLGWGTALSFRFVHVGDDGQQWSALTLPPDLPAIPGARHGAAPPLTSRHVPPERRHAPRLLPQWPFVPVGIDYPAPTQPDDANDGPLFWADGPEVQEALLRAQDPLATPQAPKARGPALFARPFAAFPHDWAAVRVMAAAVLDKLARPSAIDWSAIDWRRVGPGAEEAGRVALLAAWHTEASSLYDEAIAHPAGATVAADRADALWDRIARFEPLLSPTFDALVNVAVNLSLGLGSEAASAIPARRVEACADWHKLATVTLRDAYPHEFKPDRHDLPQPELDALYARARAAGELKQVRDVWAPPPDRMFGPPSYVQGDVEELVEEWLLLLELPVSSALGVPMGDGVLQFLIRPADLRLRRFDRVQAICTGY